MPGIRGLGFAVEIFVSPSEDFLKSRENGKCRSGGGQSRTSCLLGLGNEGGNNRKPSKDAGLGGFANSREDRGVRKIHRKPKGPEVQKIEANLEQQQSCEKSPIFWERGSCQL